MAKYLIDTNLPYYFSIWNTEDYIHQNDIDPSAADNSIWNYAKDKELTIITKDADFSDLMLLKEPPPRVIHIKFGNVKMKEFHQIISKCWDQVLTLSKTHKLVNVLKDSIQGIN